jgi:secreted PhoX family phosphatase
LLRLNDRLTFARQKCGVRKIKLKEALMTYRPKAGPAANNGETFEDVLSRRIARRSFLKGALMTAPILVAGPSFLKPAQAEPSRDGLNFQPISLDNQDQVLVPDGYEHHVLARWGDPLFKSSPSFDPFNQTPQAQRLQFGYNCDYVSFLSLSRERRFNSRERDSNGRSALLFVNHEYTNEPVMFPGYDGQNPTAAQVDIAIAAHGCSIFEIEESRSKGWQLVERSDFNRRITGETEMRLTGPAAGDDLMKVSYDPTGTRVRGMLNNCGGGNTPWGTVLTCEENFNQYFANRAGLPDVDPRKAVHSRYGVGSNVSGFAPGRSERGWELYHDRFDLTKEPNEPFRFGWVIEIDPYDPKFEPKKRTALGRVKHEAATTVVARDGRVAVYTGDDERFEYMYKFVTKKKFDKRNRDANFALLDEGILHVAKFNDDGTGQWLPLVFGQGNLVPPSFSSQADVLIRTRFAADAAGGTKMDRPEDIETNPSNGKVYCAMTNNTNRGVGSNPGVNGANPRTPNRHGQIIEITENENNAASLAFKWEIFLLCGNPDTDPVNSPAPPLGAEATYFGGFDHSRVSALSSPDNIAFDRRGNLWIATDGQPTTFQMNDGIFAVPVTGEERGFLRQFLSGVFGAEVASLHFGADDRALFVSIQHPGEPGTGPNSRNSTFENPTSVWPDNQTPPRPSVIVITKTGRGSPVIGT